MKEKKHWYKIRLIFCLLSISVYGKTQDNFYMKLSDAAISIINPSIRYVPDYVKISYPGGDVHEDMKANFSVYPKSWDLKQTDKNIDHRRVPNLMKFFSRHGNEFPISKKEEDYKPGDIVCWLLSNGQTHIGIVVDKKILFGNRYKIVHNIGYGQVLEDCLFAYKIIGHYRYKK